MEGVGVMKDKEVKIDETEASLTQVEAVERSNTFEKSFFPPGFLVSTLCVYFQLYKKRRKPRVKKKKKNPCPREGMFRGSFARARGRDEG